MRLREVSLHLCVSATMLFLASQTATGVCALPHLTELRIRKCYSEFRQHYIERHGLDRNDIEARVHLDLIEYTFTLLNS